MELIADHEVWLKNSSNVSCNETFTADQRNGLIFAHSGSALASTVMCVVTVPVVLWFRLHKHIAYRLALYQILSTLFYSITEVLTLLLLNFDKGKSYYLHACTATAFLIMYSLWVQQLFTLWLTFHLFCFAVFFKNLQKLELVYIITSLFLPVIPPIIPLTTNSYGISGAWCWIREWNDNCATRKYITGIIEQFTIWWGPLFATMIINSAEIIIMLIVLAYRACSYGQSKEERHMLNTDVQNKMNVKKEALKKLLPLMAYPLIFFALSLIPIVEKIYHSVSRDSSYFLAFFHALATPSGGIFVSIALLIHVCTLQKTLMCHINKYKQVQKPPVSEGIPVPTITRACTTHYSAPAESAADSAFLINKRGGPP